MVHLLMSQGSHEEASDTPVQATEILGAIAFSVAVVVALLFMRAWQHARSRGSQVLPAAAQHRTRSIFQHPRLVLGLYAAAAIVLFIAFAAMGGA